MGPSGHKLTVFYEVYSPKVLKTIAERAKSDASLRALDSRLHPHNEYLACDRVHLDKCLAFSKQHNALDQDRLSRLRQPQNFHTWQSVYNELLVPYFLAKVFKLQIDFVTNPKRKGIGDFQVIHPEGRIMVEVKTSEGDDPNLQGPDDTVHEGLDEDLLRPTFLDGARQLRRGNKNLVVICTQLCAWIHDWMPFEKLFYGQEFITRNFNSDRGELVGPTKSIFVPDGELHRPKQKKGKEKKYTRISAIASFKNDIFLTRPFSEKKQQIQFIVFHNYYALCPIEASLFADAEQFIADRSKGTIEHFNKDQNEFVIQG